jgi:hypothetical protein
MAQVQEFKCPRVLPLMLESVPVLEFRRKKKPDQKARRPCDIICSGTGTSHLFLTWVNPLSVVTFSVCMQIQLGTPIFPTRDLASSTL